MANFIFDGELLKHPEGGTQRLQRSSSHHESHAARNRMLPERAPDFRYKLVAYGSIY
jgi:hypothetical protein